MNPNRWHYDRHDERGSWMALVAASSWWPDTVLEVGEPFPGALELRVELRTPDSFEPERIVRIGHRKPLPEHIHRGGPDVMEAHLRRCLREVAVHEADEWLVIADRRPFNPHHPRGAVHA